MYSTLRKQPNLNRFPSKYLGSKALMSWLPFSKDKFYFISRNPYKRFESFYKDKFLRAEVILQTMIKEKRTNLWQDSTAIFFPYLNLSKDMDSAELSKALEATAFKDVVQALPKVYLTDGHTAPQHLSKTIETKKFNINFKIPIHFKKIFKIESKDDLNELSQIFDIDLNLKANSTKHMNNSVNWSEETKQIVDHVYSKDFSRFNYPKQLP